MTCPQSVDPSGPLNPQPSSSATHLAIAAGPLTLDLLEFRIAQAHAWGRHPIEVFTDPEIRHIRLIQVTLGRSATWEEVAAVIRSSAQR